MKCWQRWCNSLRCFDTISFVSLNGKGHSQQKDDYLATLVAQGGRDSQIAGLNATAWVAGQACRACGVGILVHGRRRSRPAWHIYIYIYIYIYICLAYMLDSCQQKPVQGPQKLKKNASFCRTEPSRVTVQGPPKSQLEGHSASPKMRRECGPSTGSLVGPEPAFKLVIFESCFCFTHFSWNPYFYSVCVQIPFKMLNF